MGGGIAGLSAAFTLAQSSARQAVSCTLIESSSRLGGKIYTERAEGFIVEGGPDSFLSQKPWGLELCRSLGIEDRLIGTNPERRQTFVYSRGRMHELPEGLAMGVPSKLGPFLQTDLLSWPGKLRMAAEPFIPRRRNTGDEPLGSFFRRRFGTEALERIIEPLMTGIFAGDAERMSIQATFPRFPEMERVSGSVVKAMLGARKRGAGPNPRWTPFVTLRGGLTELVDTIASRLGPVRVVTGRPVKNLRVRAGGGYELALDGESLAADALILATPAYDAASLLESVDRPAAELLRGIPYVSTATVSLGYRQAGFGHTLDGYGFVVPRAEGRPLLASTWTSSKWAHRTPDGSVLIRSYVGGAGREAVLDRPDAALIDLVREELRGLMGITEQPALAKVYRWPSAMPQYLVGHLDRIAGIETALARVPGVFLAGAAYRGIGIPDCIRDGMTAAQRVCAYFDKGTAPSV